jgi:branched-chain amino acid transport system ATP-binding protein
MALLEIRSVASGYGEVQILWGVDLSLKEGQLTSLVGANGAGKTTILRTVMGLLRPWEGSVWFNEQDVSQLPAHAKAELGSGARPRRQAAYSPI